MELVLDATLIQHCLFFYRTYKIRTRMSKSPCRHLATALLLLEQFFLLIFHQIWIVFSLNVQNAELDRTGFCQHIRGFLYILNPENYILCQMLLWSNETVLFSYALLILGLLF